MFTEGLYKSSILAKYVFYNWYKESVSTLTGIGEVNLQGANSTTVEPNQRLVAVWNDFLREYQYKNIGNKVNVYSVGGIPVYDWYNGNDNNFVSLLQFLTDKSTDYPDATMKMYDYLNQFGI